MKIQKHSPETVTRSHTPAGSMLNCRKQRGQGYPDSQLSSRIVPEVFCDRENAAPKTSVTNGRHAVVMAMNPANVIVRMQLALAEAI
jgi:hypothetical protein